MNGAAEAIDRFHIGNIERHQRRIATQFTDIVVQLFKPADGASDCDYMCAAFCQFKRKKIANTARCACYQCDAARKVDAHLVPI